MINKKIILSIYALSFLIFFSAQYTLNSRIKPAPAFEDLKYVPSGKFLKGIFIGYDEVAADFLWIKALSYFADHNRSDRDYRWLYHILNLVTTLDPRYLTVYEFGGIVLALEQGDVDNSIKLLKKGMVNIPKNNSRYWYLPFLISFNYMYHKHEYAKAANYLEIAAKYPGSPKYLPLMVATLHANADNYDIAVSFLRSMIDVTDNHDLKNQLVRRLAEVIHFRDIENLKAAKERFEAEFKRTPENLQEIVRSGILKSIPEDPLGGRYMLSGEKEVISTSRPERLMLNMPDDGMMPKIIPKKSIEIQGK